MTNKEQLKDLDILMLNYLTRAIELETETSESDCLREINLAVSRSMVDCARGIASSAYVLRLISTDDFFTLTRILAHSTIGRTK